MHQSFHTHHPARDDTRVRVVARRQPSMVARVVVVIALLTAIVSVAQAQILGRLRRVVSDRTPPREAQAQAPRLEITAERIDAFLVAMRPVVAYAELVQAARVSQGNYESRKSQFEACKERVGRSVAGPSAQFTAAQQERVGELAIRNTELMAAYQAAAAAGNQRAANALLDTMDLAGLEVQEMQFPALAACGKPAPRPVPPPPPPAPTQGEMIAQSPGGMTGSQFGRLRELIAVHLLTNGHASGFSAAEQSAFGARQTELELLAPLFRSGALEWSRWDSLGKNWRAQ
jgi:hypothetical protein